MLEANKKFWFEKLFSLYNRNFLKRRFHSLNVENFLPLKERDKKLPLIIYANHSSWWDGLVIFELLKGKHFDSFVMMEEKHLEKLNFFRMLGAFSVIRENSREGIKSVEYILKILKSKQNRTLLIFPQGEILPNDSRPLKFFGGISVLVEKLGECNIVPCSIRYEFLGDYKPEIFVKFGGLQTVRVDKDFKRKEFTHILEREMTENLDELKSEIIEKKMGIFQKLF